MRRTRLLQKPEQQWPYRVPVLVDVLVKVLRDEIATNDEEDIDTRKPARKPRRPVMEKQNGQDRDRAKAIDIRPIIGFRVHAPAGPPCDDTEQ
jgi:hypothetical protein